ncbi:hypothetical protein D3C78_1678720 [compost metagenome]
MIVRQHAIEGAVVDLATGTAAVIVAQRQANVGLEGAFAEGVAVVEAGEVLTVDVTQFGGEPRQTEGIG